MTDTPPERGRAALVLLALAFTLLALWDPPIPKLFAPDGDEAPDDPSAAAAASDGRFREPTEEKLIARGDAPRLEADKRSAEGAGVLGALASADDALRGPELDEDARRRLAELSDTKGVPSGSGGLASREGGLDAAGKAAPLGGLSAKGRGSTSYGYGQGYVSHLVPLPTGGDPIILGAISRDELEAVIQAAKTNLRACYVTGPKETTGLYGKLVIKFVIDKHGQVSSATVKSTTVNHPSVEDCFIQRIQELRFPPPKGGGIAIISYPFWLSPG